MRLISTVAFVSWRNLEFVKAMFERPDSTLLDTRSAALPTIHPGYIFGALHPRTALGSHLVPVDKGNREWQPTRPASRTRPWCCYNVPCNVLAGSSSAAVIPRTKITALDRLEDTMRRVRRAESSKHARFGEHCGRSALGLLGLCCSLEMEKN